MEKVRINISVDKVLLNKARKKLGLFGGKVSTLFNAYLSDFVKSYELEPGKNFQELTDRVKELETKIERMEKIK